MAIAPLIVRIQAIGTAALARASAALRAAGTAIAAAGRAAVAASPALARMVAALRRIGTSGPMLRLVAMLRAIGTAAASAARSVASRVIPVFARLAAVLQAVASAAFRAAVVIGGLLRSALRSAADAAQRLTRSLVMLALRWLAIADVVIPAVIALAQLLPLAMHLAPAVLAAGAALLVLKLGLDGVSDAFKAGLSGDAEEFADALKKLAPAAQDFVKELVKVAPAWRDLKTLVQQRLFAGLAGEVQKVSDALGPIAVTWLPAIASQFNRFFTAIAKGLQSPEFARQMEVIMKGVSVFIDGFLHAVRMLGRAFLDIAEVAAPAFGEMGANIGIAAEKFSTWIQEMKDNGTLKRWLDTAKETFGQIMDIGHELGRVFAAIFQGTDTEGFLEGLRNSIQELADWLESENGQAVIEFFSDVAVAAASLIVTIANVVRWFQDGIDQMRELTRGLREALHGDFGAIGAAASGLFSIISGGVNAFSWIGGVLSRLGGLVRGVQNAVSAINAALSAIRTRVNIDIVTRRSEEQGFARAIGSGGGGGGGTYRHRAGGGPVVRGESYIVGERGRPEVFVPSQSGRIFAGAQSGAVARLVYDGPRGGLDALFATWFEQQVSRGRIRLN